MKKIKKVTIVTGIISLVMAGGYIVRNVYSESKSRLENLRVSHKQGFYEKYIKRPQDFCCALAATIVLSPIMGITALLVRVKLGSPVIFKQERPGLNGKIFTLYKFRTMTDEKDENGNLLSDDVRLTKFGRMLRTTSLMNCQN